VVSGKGCRLPRQLHGLVCRGFDRQDELKRCARSGIRSRPQPAAVRLDNRAADPQSHSGALRFGRVPTPLLPLLPIGLTISSHYCWNCSSHTRLLASNELHAQCHGPETFGSYRDQSFRLVGNITIRRIYSAKSPRGTNVGKTTFSSNVLVLVNSDCLLLTDTRRS
jgi:hypothetical protein